VLIKVIGIEIGHEQSSGEPRRAFVQHSYELHINPERVVYVKLPEEDGKLARLRVDTFETWIYAEHAQRIIDQINQAQKG